MATNYPLNAESIDRAAEHVARYCEAQNMSDRDALGYRLSVEEVLGHWLDAGAGESFTIDTGKRRILLELAGRACNPFAEEDEDSFLLRSLRASQESAPHFTYRRRKNRVTWAIPKKRINPIIRLLIMIAFGAAAGFALKGLLSADALAALLEDFINPVYSAVFRLIGYAAGPLILLSVVWGIYGIGDASTFGKLGRRLVRACLLALLAVSLFTTVTIPLQGLHLSTDDASGGSSFGAILKMLLDIIPSNIVSPFMDGNMLQIIFTAVVLGVAMLMLGSRAGAVGELVEQSNSIVQLVMGVIGRIMPVFIALIVARLILTDAFSVSGLPGGFFLMLIGFHAVAAALLLAFTCIYLRVSPRIILRKSMPVMLLALTTASSSACLGRSMEVCEKEFGIDRSTVGFSLPLGTVLFKLGTAFFLPFGAYYYLSLSGAAVAPSTLVIAMFTCAIMSIAYPTVAGSGAIVWTMIFAQLGLSDELLTVAISIDAIYDFIMTSMNVFGMQLLLLCIAHGSGKIDRSVLCK